MAALTAVAGLKADLRRSLLDAFEKGGPQIDELIKNGMLMSYTSHHQAQQSHLQCKGHSAKLADFMLYLLESHVLG